MNDQWLQKAIRLAQRAAERNLGGPFGALIVKADRVVGRGWNKVTSANDPTAHAEIVAIRSACHRLKSFRLDDCVMYSSCEPCPMCLAAIYWARIPTVFFGATKEDAARIGFDDDNFYQQLALPQAERKVRMVQMLAGEAQMPFRVWTEKPDKVPY